MENEHNLSDNTIELIKSAIELTALSMNDIKFNYTRDDKQRTIFKVSLIPNMFKGNIDKDVNISVNEELLDTMNDSYSDLTKVSEKVDILLRHELDKIIWDNEKDVVKLQQPQLKIHKGMGEKYGVTLLSDTFELEKMCLNSLKESKKVKKIKKGKK